VKVRVVDDSVVVNGLVEVENVDENVDWPVPVVLCPDVFG